MRKQELRTTSARDYSFCVLHRTSFPLPGTREARRTLREYGCSVHALPRLTHSVTPSSELHNPRRGRVSRDTIGRRAIDRYFEVARVSVLRGGSKSAFKAIIDVVYSATPGCTDAIRRCPVNIH